MVEYTVLTAVLFLTIHQVVSEVGFQASNKLNDAAYALNLSSGPFIGDDPNSESFRGSGAQVNAASGGGTATTMGGSVTTADDSQIQIDDG
ncbi:MAG: hypothetical protein DCC75_12720 [Proteobacteria bacterium]|nr:MAG: hypothetical protein DCC75_12720 [Pseudomonadota bacterium]